MTPDDVRSERAAVKRATAIAMERYEFSESSASGLLRRLARHHNVALSVVAAAIIAAQVARTTR